MATTTLDAVDRKTQLLDGDFGRRRPSAKERSGRGISLGGVKLAAAGLVDENTCVAHPVVAGRGPRLLDGLRDQVRLEPVERRQFRSGATLQRYRAVS